MITAHAQAALERRKAQVPRLAGALVQQLRGDAVRPALDLASPAAVSALLFKPAPEGLALVPPPCAKKGANGFFSTNDAVRRPSRLGQCSLQEPSCLLAAVRRKGEERGCLNQGRLASPS